MKLILHELYKQLSGRVLWLVMVLLVLLNIIFCLREVEKDYNADRLAALKAADSIVRENPEEIYAQYQAMLALNEAYEEEEEEWFNLQMEYMTGLISSEELPPEPESPDFPSQYYEGMDDFQLLDLYYGKILTADEYAADIEDKRTFAQETLDSYRAAGYSKDTYAYRYQVRFWNIYGDTLGKVEIDDSLTYGWDAFWGYGGSGIFLLLAALLAGSRLFTVERDSGMEPVLRACRRGRGALALGKLGAATLWMLGASLVFHLSALLACGWRYGLSSPFAPIQQSLIMRYCPFAFSQLGTFLLTVLFSALAALAICLLTASLTLLLKKALPAIALSALVVGAQFYLLEKGGEYLSTLNLLTATDPQRLWERWSPIHIMGGPISYLPFLIAVLAVVALLTAAVALIRWVCCGMGSRTIRRIALPQLPFKWKLPLRKLRRHSVRLFPYEWRKSTGMRMAIICLLLIALQAGISLNALNGEPTFYDEMKQGYMLEYDGLTLEEQDTAITERLAIYAEATREGKSAEMAAKRLDDEITFEEYAAYCDLLNEALTYKDTLTAYREELHYLMEKGEALGIETYPVIATGFVTWASRPFDIPVVLLLFVLLAGIFAREHETKFMPLLRTTKRGRQPVWIAKLKLATLCVLAVTVAALVLDIALLVLRYPTDCLSAPLVCISRYRDTASDIKVIEYILLVCLLRIVGTLVWGLIITALSQLLRSEWATAGCMLLLLLPYGLTLLGVPSAQIVDITMLLSGDRLWLASTAGGGMTLLTLFTAISAALTALLVTASYKKFCK